VGSPNKMNHSYYNTVALIKLNVVSKDTQTFIDNAYCYITDLRPVVSLTAVNNPTVGQPLLLECTVTTACIIRGEVTIVWSMDGVELRSTRGVDVSSYTESSVVYVENYTIPQLHKYDNGKLYQCEVMINTSILVTAAANLTIALSGKCLHVKTCELIYALT